MRKLSDYKRNVYSQFGEDGVIEKIFDIITPGQNPWCVEFGAWDGVHFSNTYNLIKNKGWRAALIEPEKRRYQELLKTHKDNGKVLCLNKFINFRGKDTLDKILSGTPIPKDFNFLSIDIDGNDYYIWESLRRYRPKVVIIEFNPTIPHDVEYVQAKDFGVNQGSSLLSLVKLAKRKGYELIAATDANAIFVIKKLYPRFKITENSLSALHDNRKYESKFFQLMDGTIVLTGCKELLWHQIKFNDEDFQILPKFLRRFPNKYNILLTLLYKRNFKGLANLLKRI